MNINKTLIKRTATETMMESSDLHVEVFDAEEFSAGVLAQVHQQLSDADRQEFTSLQTQLEKVDKELELLRVSLTSLETQLDQELISGNSETDSQLRRRVRVLENQMEMKVKQIQSLEARRRALNSRLGALTRRQQLDANTANDDANIVTDAVARGEITPFAAVAKSEKPTKVNRFDAKCKLNTIKKSSSFSQVKPKKIRLSHNFSEDPQLSGEEFSNDEEDADYEMEEDELEDEEKIPEMPTKRKQTSIIGLPKSKRLKLHNDKNSDDRFVDDALFDNYRQRLELYRQKLLDESRQPGSSTGLRAEAENGDLGHGVSVPARIWSRLYVYQQTGVRWLWELHQHGTGGIMGDEMGLGKTIQIIAFLAALQHSAKPDKMGFQGLGPVLIVAPASVLEQWVREFHAWCPVLRVAVLHASGSGYDKPVRLIHNLVHQPGVVVTTYNTLVLHRKLILKYQWHYIILDEGHKIKNPDAMITMTCKRFATPHRLILTATPMQNSCRELWSLFDFVYPGKLGTLPEFQQQFAVPLVQGGYSTASALDVETAYRCACALRDLIRPYLIRRMKADVRLQLPDKREQVLFCRLTDYQREIYQEYLDSKQCKQILTGHMLTFPGLITLRKICNHPDLATGALTRFDPELAEREPLQSRYGWMERSGKMLVVHTLLQHWRQEGHKVLLFSQSRAMLRILERHLVYHGMSFLRMDGGTPVAVRHRLVQQFNHASSSECFVFLLTTRVGGLGINLTGANRVLLFDPDWNPSTDMQARERAWRIGQTRDVVIYRLLTSGTIEEKIYHRQIFKQFLSNRILKNPRQKRFFKANDLHELFTLTPEAAFGDTETGALFHDTGLERKLPQGSSSTASTSRNKVGENRFDLLHKRQKKKKDSNEEGEGNEEGEEEWPESLEEMEVMQGEGDIDEEEEVSEKLEDYIQDQDELERRRKRLRKLARKLSQKIAAEFQNTPLATESKQEGDGDTKKTAVEPVKPPKKKDKKHRHRKRHGARLEGIRIPQLEKHALYDAAEDPEDTEKTKKDSTEYVLQSLLPVKNLPATTGHSEEAEKVALDAIKHLSSSAKHCMEHRDVNQLTWTGQHGNVGKERYLQKVLPKKEKLSQPPPPSAPSQKSTSATTSAKNPFSFFGSPIKPSDIAVHRNRNPKTSVDNLSNGLLGGAGVESALEHHLLMEDEASDYALLEAEAERIAQHAVTWLQQRAMQGRQSWMSSNSTSVESTRLFGRDINLHLWDRQEDTSLHICLDSVGGGVTFSNPSHTQHAFSGSTSNFTLLGARCNPLAEGRLSSAALFTIFQAHQLSLSHHRAASSMSTVEEAGKSKSHSNKVHVRVREIAEDLRDFVAFQAGDERKADTQAIVNHFKDKIRTEENFLFRAILKSICYFQKVNGTGWWHLQDKFH